MSSLTMGGRIIKAISGFYYVYVAGAGIITCRAKGVFRKNKITPLVGDQVKIEIISMEEKEGNVVSVEERKNSLIRPSVANVDLALVIFAMKEPNPNFNILNKYLVSMEKQGVESIICFNKEDLCTKEEIDYLKSEFSKTPYKVFFISVKDKKGIAEVKKELKGKTATVAGPSGAGKSSLINEIVPDGNEETGEISEKIKRGKQTTRHTRLIVVDEDTFIIDTPGFTSMSIDDILCQELWNYFPEFTEYEKECRFVGCAHINEPDCGIKEALKRGEISKLRYDNYTEIYQELKQVRRYR
ncbi:ribosome biogenesis GTPase [Acetitomaculum ruminis DSM 5522]|uniref:Small ribosomal subunit biogenesis GTPase RsgA n=2 Tax=Acetitomaculum ruminis TaxID=2382 RepID=A0A1I0XUQ8_9FIRM|nr:ribosome biogenesis GTPase [Acetitomaculum ruminis DSM 5522]